MKTILLFLMAACVACVSVAEARGVEATVTYPVPVLPVEGWAPAIITLKKSSAVPNRRFEITSSREDIRCSTESLITGTLKDSKPHKYTAYLHLRDDYQFQNTNNLRLWTDGRQGKRRIASTRGLQVGRSVVGLVSGRGILLARTSELLAILEAPSGTWNWGTLPSNVVIAEHTDEKLLPDSWIGYDLLQAMVIEDFPYGKLSPAQEDAIVQWVENGGTLLVSPGRKGNVFQSNLLNSLVQFEVRGSQTLERPPIQGLPKSGSGVVKWDVSVAAAKDTPLAQIVRCGAGTVVVFKYDILRAPFSEWPGLKSNLQGIIQIPAKTSRQNPRHPLHWKGKEKSLPSATTVAGILGAYLLAIGPANYLMLRRRKKLVLMPFTIAGIAVAFTIMIVIYGYVSRGASTELRQCTLVRTHPGRTTAFATTQKGIYASSNKAFVMTFDDSAALRKVAARQQRYGGDESPLQVTDTGTGTLQARFTSPMWEVFTIEARAALPEFGSLQIVGPAAKPTVVNATIVDLEDCWLRQSNRWYAIGKLPRGARKSRGRDQRPPADVRKLIPRGSDTIVVGRVRKGTQPVIPWRMKRGRARTVQDDTYVMGAAQ